MTWSVVVPTNRPERFAEFMKAWEPLFRRRVVDLYPVIDGDDIEPYKKAAHKTYGYKWEFQCWNDIPDFIPRKTDMIRSWGIYKAWERGSTYTLTLDDDVLPEGDLFAEYERVFERGAPCSDYLDVGALTSYDGQLRGFPFADRKLTEVAIQYGGWNGVLDFDAPTQLATQPGEHRFADVVLPVPRGAAVTGCIMNCAWRTEYAPIMWQLPLLDGRFNRFGDIWSCLFQKRTLDALGKVMVVNGKASVRHERASDPIANLERETPGIRPNEEIWADMNGNVALSVSKGLTRVYEEATSLAMGGLFPTDPKYVAHFYACRDKWLALFD